MSTRVEFFPTPGGTEFRLLVNDVRQPVDSWAITAPSALLPAVDLLNRLAAEELALADSDFVLVEHAAIANLSAAEAAALGLPPLSEAVARIETSGIVTNPAFSASLQWRRPTGQVLGAAAGCSKATANRWMRDRDQAAA